MQAIEQFLVEDTRTHEKSLVVDTVKVEEETVSILKPFPDSQNHTYEASDSKSHKLDNHTPHIKQFSLAVLDHTYTHQNGH